MAGYQSISFETEPVQLPIMPRPSSRDQAGCQGHYAVGYVSTGQSNQGQKRLGKRRDKEALQTRGQRVTQINEDERES